MDQHSTSATSATTNDTLEAEVVVKNGFDAPATITLEHQYSTNVANLSDYEPNTPAGERTTPAMAIKWDDGPRNNRWHVVVEVGAKTFVSQLKSSDVNLKDSDGRRQLIMEVSSKQLTIKHANGTKAGSLDMIQVKKPSRD